MDWSVCVCLILYCVDDLCDASHNSGPSHLHYLKYHKTEFVALFLKTKRCDQVYTLLIQKKKVGFVLKCMC